ERLRSYLDQHHAPTDKAIVAGDFNVAPTPLDLHNPDANEGSVLYSRPERDAYQDLMQWGFIDLLRLKFPEERIYTWWDYRQLAFAKNQGWRIDHILGSEAVARGCRDVWVEREERKGEK